MKHSLLFTIRIGTAAAVVAAQMFAITPALAARPDLTDIYQWRIDNEWLTTSQGGFGNAYPYDSGTFYYTLPSRSKSSALHPYFRNTYYQYYHELPPPPGAIMPLTWREAYDCGNYSFMRPNRVMPYGFKCQK